MTVLYFVLSHYPTAVPAPTSQILKNKGSYEKTNILDGLISRWATYIRWRWAKASIIDEKNDMTSSSSKNDFLWPK